MSAEKSVIDIMNKRTNGKLPEYFKVIMIQQPYSKILYTYTSDILISNHDQTNIASQIRSNITFGVTKAIKDKKILVKFEILDTFIHNSNPEGQKLSEMGKLFALPINKLILQLTEKGDIKDVLNKAEIAQKWNDLFDDISQEMDEDKKQIIRKKGDKDYMDPLKSIKGSFLHDVFFIPIFKTTFSNTTAGRFSLNNKLKLLENIDTESNFTGKVEYVDENIIVAEYKNSIDDDSASLSRARKLYGDLVPKKSNFHEESKMIYQFDIQNSLPLQINIKYEELIEGALRYTQISEIKRLS